MAEQRLTPAGADARLPFVAAVAADAADLSTRLVAAVAAYRAERRRPLPSQVALNEGKAAIDRIRASLDDCVSEVADAGGRLGDASSGYVDFPAAVGGEDVLLCWRLGEPRVEHFHGDDDPHAARRPLSVPVPA